MSHYYDPWGHAARLFFNRLLLWVFLSLLLGLGGWAVLLHEIGAADLVAVARSTWEVLREPSVDVRWRALLGLCVIAGALLTSCLFLWLGGRAKLRKGDRHRRGARVVRDDDDHGDD